jgi:hypothetical protein
MQSLLATWKPRSKGIRWIRASGSALLVQIMLSSEAEPEFEVRTGDKTEQCHRLSGLCKARRRQKWLRTRRNHSERRQTRAPRADDDIQNELMCSCRGAVIVLQQSTEPLAAFDLAG